MLVLKVLFLWVICFYSAIIAAALIKGVKLNLFTLYACLISPKMFMKLNSEIVKNVCKILYHEKNIIVNKRNKRKLKIQMAIFTFPEFLNFYFDVLESIEWEKVKSMKAKKTAMDKQFSPYKSKVADKFSYC